MATKKEKIHEAALELRYAAQGIYKDLVNGEPATAVTMRINKAEEVIAGLRKLRGQ